MNLEKTSIILKKINRLHELISTIGESSSTETDLLKAYVVDLYEAVAMSDIQEIKDLEAEEMRKKMKKQKKSEKKLKKKVIKKSLVSHDDEDDDEDDDVVENVKVTVKPSKAIPKIKAVKEKVIEDAPAEPSPKKELPKISPALQDLFDFNSNAELSDKLANSPIADLTKAMGINEKIFTVNELFGGDQKEMDNILLALNGLDNFDEAKSILMHSIAQKNNWSETSKVKKAKNFIKLVKRRYN